MKVTTDSDTLAKDPRVPIAGAHAGRDTATVLNVQRMSTEDGPGLRTTVFLKGCSLQCTWCHNPESMCFRPHLVWHRSKCLAIGACDPSCPEKAIALADGVVTIDRALYTLCGDCVESCPSGALEMQGTVRELEELLDHVAKDRSYFESSGGGVTISGGEPVLQAPFVLAFLDRCRDLGIRTAVDTCGLCASDALLEVARRTDLLLYDLKEIDNDKHTCFTGQSNTRILENAAALATDIRANDHRAPELWIRTPLIPGATFSDENIGGIGAFIAERMNGVVSRWELCAFNNLAGDKYERLALEWQFSGAPLLTADELAHAGDVARRSGVDPAIVVTSGRTHFEETSR